MNEGKKVLLLIKSFLVNKKCTQKAVNNAVFQGSLKKTHIEYRNKE